MKQNYYLIIGIIAVLAVILISGYIEKSEIKGCIDGKKSFDILVSKYYPDEAQVVAKIMNVSNVIVNEREITKVTLQGINESLTIDTYYFSGGEHFCYDSLENCIKEAKKDCECEEVSGENRCFEDSYLPQYYCKCKNASFRGWFGKDWERCFSYSEQRENVSKIRQRDVVERDYWITHDDIGKYILVNLSIYGGGKAGKICCSWNGHEFIDCNL